MDLIWIIVFIVSLTVLIKGTDWLLKSAEKIGLAIGLSPFIIGVTIVGIGTSFPELISSLVAVFKNVTEIAPANAIGSNIANILLVVGFSAVFAKRLVVTKSLIDLDLPLLAISTVLFLGVVKDRQITFFEALLMVGVYIIYLLYTAIHREETEKSLPVLPSRPDRRKHIVSIFSKKNIDKPKVNLGDFLLLIVGITGLFFGAKYLIEAVIKLSQIFSIAPAIISITAVAIGTSLPELIVSIKAAIEKKPEVALGNIFGSNVFNLLAVVGIPGLFKTLLVDNSTFLIGLPTMALATLLFVISGISKRIHIWEGLMYLAIYILFIAKLFSIF